MINVKDQIYAALAEKFGSDAVTDSYPKNWESLPAVEYVEEDNKVAEWADDRETIAYCRYRIDIWNNKSTSASALLVDEALAPLGLKRTQCADVDDPSGLKHKVMRYEIYIDVSTQDTYHDVR